MLILLLYELKSPLEESCWNFINNATWPRRGV